MSNLVALNASRPAKSALRALAPAPAGVEWHATEHWITIGNRTVYWLLGGLIVFMAFTSINGAVIATGTVTAQFVAVWTRSRGQTRW